MSVSKTVRGGSSPSGDAKFGNVVEWPMASVLKTEEPKGSVSSNLTVSANNIAQKQLSINQYSVTIHVLKD